MSEISPESPQKFRHADPEKVRLVWDVLEGLKASKQVVPTDKLIRNLRKKINVKDDNIRLLLNEIEGDGLIDKSSTASNPSKPSVGGYRLPDFKIPFMRQDHDWYCFKCHSAGVVFSCSDCFRVFHQDCVNDIVRKTSPIRSPILHDMKTNFLCPVCKSRPKCEFSRKQIRKLLDFATHNLRKQALWKTFINIGYKNIVKNEFLVYKYIDLEILNQKIKDGRYTALENFAVDVELLVHNICILHGPFSHEADEARFFLRSVKMEIIEIELCTDCYINAKAKPSEWISKPCKPCHELIWASNRTPRGAGMFSDAVIAEYYWPAKILMEKDDGYEIRFFGGTHERMFVLKENTKSFKIPPSNMQVLRKSSNHGSQCGSGGFEKAWNEIQKLQNNIDSGYYTHSSGESDLPPSDDDYSDEMYIGPKRSKILTKFKESSHLISESPRSSLNSISHSKVSDRKRHESSTSNQASSITSSINPSVSPNPNLPRSRGRPSNISKKQNIQPEPGSAAALAMTVLAETKAALNSGSSLGLTKFLESSSSGSLLKTPTTMLNGKRKPANSISPKKARKSRPEKKRYKNDNDAIDSSSSSSSSSSASSSPSSLAAAVSNSSLDLVNNKKFSKTKKEKLITPKPRGRPPSNGLKTNHNNKSFNLSLENNKAFKTKQQQSKPSISSTPLNTKQKQKLPVKKKKSSSPPKTKSRKLAETSESSSSESSQSEDELTDRCVSEDHQSSNAQSDNDESSSSSDSDSSSSSSKSSSNHSTSRKQIKAAKKTTGRTSRSSIKKTKTSLSSVSREMTSSSSRKKISDITLKRPPFAPKPMFKGEQSSSSKEGGIHLIEDSLDVIPKGLKFSFDRRRFLKREYEPHHLVEYIHQIGVTFEEFHLDLQQYLNILKISLVELVNRDYHVFVNLSVDLHEIRDVITMIKQPLDEYFLEISEFHERIRCVKNTLKGLIDEESALDGIEEQIKNLRVISECIDRLESWLDPLKNNETSQQSDSLVDLDVFRKSKDAEMFDLDVNENLDLWKGLTQWPEDCLCTRGMTIDPGERVDRVTDELIKLENYSSQLPDDQGLLRKWSPRIKWIKTTVESLLESRLKTGINICLEDYNKGSINNARERTTSLALETTGSVLKQAIQAFAALNKTSQAEKIYGEYRIRDELSKIMTFDETFRSATDDEDFGHRLGKIYTNLRRFIDNELTFFHFYFDQDNSSVDENSANNFNLILGTFWPIFIELLTRESELFSFAEPKRLSRAYRETMKFLDSLEDSIKTHESLTRFREDEKYQKFLSLWNLQVYFRFVHRDVVGSIENSIINIWLPFTHGNYGFRLRICENVVDNFVRIWSENVLLPPLRHRSVKLSCQLLRRIDSHLDQMTKDQRLNLDVKRLPQTQTEQQPKKAPLVTRLSLVHDILLLARVIKEKFETFVLYQFQATLDDIPRQEQDMLTDTLKSVIQELLADLVTKSKGYLDSIQEEIRKDVIILLKGMLDIPRTYRRMNRQIPTKASDYVESVFERLKEFIDIIHELMERKNQEDTGVDPNELLSISTQFVESIAELITKQALDLLTMLRRSNESMKRFREAKQLSSTGHLPALLQQPGRQEEAHNSDDFKIQQQIKVDVLEMYDLISTRTNLDVMKMPRLSQMKGTIIDNCDKL